MSIRIYAEFQDKKEFNYYKEDMLKRIPKKHHSDFYLFCGRLESTILSGKELK
tara:strand:- start:188 stop:346 length:159 start_codon:yes stop_codon:yes gene_type:complete